MPILAEHLSTNNEHYTPPEIVEPARVVLGAIDLDPASCPLANETVRATRFFTKAEDGLRHPWFGRIWLNPPGGKDGGDSIQKRWWWKLAAEYQADHVTAAIYLGFNMQILQTCQVGNDLGLPLVLHFPICVPSRRIKFLHPDEGRLVPGRAPAHASIIAYLPPKTEPDPRGRFAAVFGAVGFVPGGVR